MTNNLIAYFSASGVTREVSRKINSIIDSDIFEITPQEAYTSADLDWTNKSSRSSVEMNDKTFRPPIESTIDLNKYDNIILGFPVWWYTAPTIINTFIEECNMEDKNVYVFVTSGSTGVEGSFNDLSNAYPNNNWVKGIRLTGREDKSVIDEWLNI